MYLKPPSQRPKMTIGRFTFDLFRILVIGLAVFLAWGWYMIHYHPILFTGLVGLVIWRVAKRRK
jgi:hypothetical protein